MDFETKLAAAGATLEKLASEKGLSLTDFTEQETVDLLSTIMGEGGGEPVKTAEAPAAEPTKTATEEPKLTYGQVMAEVVKVAAANGYDMSKASPEELDDAVAKMAAVMSDPQYAVKQAAFVEKVAEADALGRVMAHSYVDELGKIAAHAYEGKETPAEERKEEEKAEKKAAFARDLRAKVAGHMPPQFAEHMKGKGEKKDEKDEKEHEKEKEAFEKKTSARAAEILIVNGINPATGTKFASEQEQVDAAALHLLSQKGYT